MRWPRPHHTLVRRETLARARTQLIVESKDFGGQASCAWDVIQVQLCQLRLVIIPVPSGDSNRISLPPRVNRKFGIGNLWHKAVQ